LVRLLVIRMRQSSCTFLYRCPNQYNQVCYDWPTPKS
jgi:hypothetical protein